MYYLNSSNKSTKTIYFWTSILAATIVIKYFYSFMLMLCVWACMEKRNFFLISHYRKKQHLQCYTKQCKIALFGTNTCSFKYIKMTLIVLIDLTLIDVPQCKSIMLKLKTFIFTYSVKQKMLSYL